ncbi:MAG: YopX family protein [Oscillospiraceae bacterium]
MAGDKCKSNWVYGGIFPQNKDGDFAIIYQQEPEIRKFPVYADTVGQYTGLTDKNGKKIFEGDIVKGIAYSAERIGVIVWIDEIASFGVRYCKSQNSTAWENSSILRCASIGKTDQFAAEIIGNIHDNPELLETAAKPAAKNIAQSGLAPATENFELMEG